MLLSSSDELGHEQVGAGHQAEEQNAEQDEQQHRT
jgi:hypothetical protein